MKDQVSVKIINLAHRLDRKEECRKEMAAIGWGEGDYAFFTARHLPDSGARGCALSHGKAIADFLFAEEKPFLLVLEDDFTIRADADFLAGLEGAIGHAGFWDVFLLAHNAAIPIARTPLKDAYRIVNAQTASAYLVGRLYASRLMEVFFRSAEMQDRVKNIPSPAREMANSLFRCDILWKHLQENDRFCAQIPALTAQRASYSDIEKKMVDYGV
jgi:GR25 family glycosyltransferase involved in LPS biosynthesis